MAIRDVIRPLEGWAVLDPAGEWLSAKVSGLLGSGRVKEPAQRHVPRSRAPPPSHRRALGVLTAATVFDVLGGESGADTADALTILGLLAVPPTALSGLSDWSDSVDSDRRLGLIHGLANAGSWVLYAAALISRRSGNRATARVLSSAGLAALAAAGYIGGHLVFARGMGVDHNVFEEAPADWTRVAREADLPAMPRCWCERVAMASFSTVMRARSTPSQRAAATRAGRSTRARSTTTSVSPARGTAAVFAWWTGRWRGARRPLPSPRSTCRSSTGTSRCASAQTEPRSPPDRMTIR